MAVIAQVETAHGDKRKLYIRLNGFEQLANHGVPAVALFRGFASEKAFRDGKQFLWERTIAFDADVSKPLWKQAYAALAAHDPTAPIAKELVRLGGLIAEAADPAVVALLKADLDTERRKLKSAEALRKGLSGAVDA